MKVVYFGKKYPKVIKTVLRENLQTAKEEDRRKMTGISFIVSSTAKTYKFTPFKALEVEDEVAKILIKNTSGLFHCVDEGERHPEHKPKASTDGYVGDIHAEKIKNLNRKIEKEIKAEKGKSIEEIIEDRKKKSKEEK